MGSSARQLYRFADLLTEPLRNGVYKPKEFHGTGSKIVNMGELFAHPRLHDAPMKRLNLTGVELKKSSLREGDLLFARRSLVAEGAGRCCIVKKINEPTTFESSIIRARPDPLVADSDYLFYYFTSPDGRESMRTILRQVAVSGIASSDLAELKVPLLSLREQKQCSVTLSLLDDRIDLLSQTNKSLELIAQSLFKSWFVDFDQVRVEQLRRDPDSAGNEIPSLFPRDFMQQTAELLPEGWSRTTLQQICEASGGFLQTGPFGSQLHARDYVADGIPVLMPQDIDNRRISTARVARVGIEHVERLARHKVEVGDIVFSRRGDVGRHAMISSAEAGWLCGTGCLLVRPGPRWPSPCYLSQAMARPETIEWLQRHAVGATMPNLNTGILGNMPLLLPSEPVLRAFESIVGVLDHRLNANLSLRSSLTHLRDTLLPRLISGKLRLPEAREIVESATA